MSDKELKPTVFVLEPEYIFDIQGALKNVTGETLEDFASRDPHATYAYLRLALMEIVPEVDRVRAKDGNIMSTAADDGPDTPKAIARQAIEARLPDPVLEPAHIELYAWEAPDGFSREARTVDRAKHLVIAFTVEPQDLA